jgi:hypothetical protein
MEGMSYRERWRAMNTPANRLAVRIGLYGNIAGLVSTTFLLLPALTFSAWIAHPGPLLGSVRANFIAAPVLWDVLGFLWLLEVVAICVILFLKRQIETA